MDLQLFTPTDDAASASEDLSPEVRRAIEIAISQRLNPQKAIMQSMHEIRDYAIREGLTREIFARMESRMESRTESRMESRTPSRKLAK